MEKQVNAGGGSPATLAIVYLLSSFFSSLVFSILAYRSRKRGNSGIGWIILSLLCMGFFGVIAYSLIMTSGPAKDAGWYYLGLATMASNGCSLLEMILSFTIKRN